jgi:hypothetical protein
MGICEQETLGMSNLMDSSVMAQVFGIFEWWHLVLMVVSLVVIIVGVKMRNKQV